MNAIIHTNIFSFLGIGIIHTKIILIDGKNHYLYALTVGVHCQGLFNPPTKPCQANWQWQFLTMLAAVDGRAV